MVGTGYETYSKVIAPTADNILEFHNDNHECLYENKLAIGVFEEGVSE